MSVQRVELLIEPMIGRDPRIDRAADWLDRTISKLVTKSLVIAETGGAEPRLRLLHTMRAHAFAKLAESGELDAVKRRFAEYTRQKHAEAVLRDKPAHPRNKQEA